MARKKTIKTAEINDAVVNETPIEEEPTIEPVVEEEIAEEVVTEEPIVEEAVPEVSAIEEPVVEPVTDVSEPVVEPVKEEIPVRVIEKELAPVEEKEVVPTEVVEEFDGFYAGQDVMINADAEAQVTGVKIPEYAYKNVYKVKKILPDRILIVCKTLSFGMSENDIHPVK